jgi:hypothetical protein
VFISDDEDPGRKVVIPDLRIGDRPDGSGEAPSAPETRLAVAEPIVEVTLVDHEIHEPYLTVVDREERRVVTFIEVVSPSNKVAGSRGRANYQQKRLEVVNSPSHWVEIDLLRAGIPFIPQRSAARGDYYVHVSRAGQRPRGQVWHIHLPQRLPVVLIPLKAGDPDVALDLQGVLDTAYDRAAYDKVVNYRGEADPRLSSDQAAWADEVLRSKGLR